MYASPWMQCLVSRLSTAIYPSPPAHGCKFHQQHFVSTAGAPPRDGAKAIMWVPRIGQASPKDLATTPSSPSKPGGLEKRCRPLQPLDYLLCSRALVICHCCSSTRGLKLRTDRITPSKGAQAGTSGHRLGDASSFDGRRRARLDKQDEGSGSCCVMMHRR